MKAEKSYIGLILVIPFFFFFIAFILYPIIYTFYLSLTKWDGYQDPQFIGFHHYIRLFNELGARITGADKIDIPGEFWLTFINTWRIWLPNIIMQLSLAMFLAVIFTNTRLKLRGINFFRAVFYFPNLVTTASLGVLIVVLLNWQHGVINQILHGPASAFPGGMYPSGFNIFTKPFALSFVVSLVQTWQSFGVSTIIIISGIQGIPKTYYEAAGLDGASTRQAFFKITLPLLRPVLTFIIVTSIIGGMQIFDIPYIFQDSGGGFITGETQKALTTMMLHIYSRSFGSTNSQFGYASAASYMLFLIIAISSVIYLMLIIRRSRGEEQWR